MPVPYGMTPVDWSGISWSTHRSPVPRYSISSGSSSGNKDSNGDGDGDGEDRREGKYSRELLPTRKRITVLPLNTRLLTSDHHCSKSACQPDNPADARRCLWECRDDAV